MQKSLKLVFFFGISKPVLQITLVNPLMPGGNKKVTHT